MTILARDILDNKIDLNALPHDVRLVFENDVVIHTTKNKIIYSNFFWDMIRKYNRIVLTDDLFVESVLGNKPLTNSTHNLLIDKIYMEFIRVYNVELPIHKEEILEDICILTNKLKNELPRYASAHVTTIDITDFIELVDHPRVAKQIDDTVNTYVSINECYQVVRDVIYNDTTIDTNSVVIAVKASMVNINQVLQAVAVRGKVTEVDGSILPNAVMGNLTNGLTDIYDFVAESRSAAKSLYFSDAKLQDSEDIARRLQHLCMVVEDIVFEDCGSTTYLPWKVQGPRLDENGSVVYAGDLPFMVGKYYANSDGSLSVIREDDKTLYGKTINLRTALHCKTKNPHNVCIKCFGELGYNKTRFANLGHLCVVTLTQILTQSILSTKHLDFSVLGSNIVLNDLTSKYFKTNKEKTDYILRPFLKRSNVKISVTMGQAPSLEDIKNIDNHEAILPLRISAIEHITIVFSNNGVIVEETLQLSQDTKRVVMTKDFLMYLKGKGWKTNNRNDFIFDLCDWDFKLSIFTLPAVEYSYSDHSNKIGSLIESTLKHIKRRCTDNASEALIAELFTIVNSKIKVNLSLLEVIVYAISIPDFDNYYLARGNDSTKLGIGTNIIKNRSLGVAYTNITIDKTIRSPRSFFKENRPDSILDVYIDAKNYLEHH